jgi:AsmA protein
LAALPLFLSAETIRAELARRIETATGRATRIDGPISFSVFPTARLSAEGIGIAGLASDTEAFSVESVSFGLSLIPLITGNIEIYGVTITRPSVLIETDESGRTNWSETEAEPSSAASIEEMIAEAPEEGAASNALAALDRLSIGRVTIADGTLVWRDRASGREQRIESANLDIRVPELDEAGTAEGDFVRNGVAHTLKLEIGERPDASRFEAVPVDLTLSSEAATVTAVGTMLSGDWFYSGTVETSGSSLVAFARSFGVELPDAPAFGKFQTAARVAAKADQILIERYAIDLGGMTAQGGAAIGLDRTRPGVGLKIEAGRVDTALFVGKAAADADEAREAPADSGSGAGSEAIDLSPLGLLDANIDFSAKELLIGSVPVTNLGLDVQIASGGLNATIRSATVNGAPGSGALVIENSGVEPAISGSIEMNGLDAAGLVILSGMDLPIDAGSVGLDVAFKTRGKTSDALLANLDGSGRVSLLNGHASRLGLAGDAAADELDDIDIVAEFSSLAAPVTAKGGLGWQGERFDMSARGEPRTLAAGGTSPIAIQASSERVKVGFNGEASLSGVGSGSISLSTSSLRNLLAWIGRPIAPGGGLGAFSIEGAIKLAEDSFSFEETSFTLDGSRGAGNGTVTFGETPNVTAGLAMTTLDVTPYLVASGAAKGGGGAGAGSAKAPSSAGWSKDPIAFGGLKAINASLNFKAEEILADKIRTGPASLIVTLADGKLSAELAEMALYSGTGAGTLSIDGAAATPSISASFRLLELQALPFLTDALGFTRVEGRGSFAFDLRTSGGNEAALVAALDGNGTTYVQDGAIRGINIPKIVRTLSVETLLGWQQSSGEKTDFSELSASFTIDDGILANDDLVMVGPLLRVGGAGRVDIPKRTLAYRIDPKIAASLDGQSGAGDLQGFVPVRVEGPWDRPRIYPEIEGILQDPKGALDQLRKLGGGLFDGLTGDGASGGDAGQGVQQPASPVPSPPDSAAAPEAPPAPSVEPPPPPAPTGQTAAPDQPPAAAAPPAPEASVPLPEPRPEDPPVEPAPADAPPPETPPQATEPAAEPPADATAPPEDPAADLLKSLLGQ